MKSDRPQLLQWAEQGVISSDKLRAALRAAGVLPSAAEWRHFVDRVLLWAGVLCLAAAVVFFIAYNWSALGRFAKFGLVQALLLGSIAVYWKFGPDRVAAQAALVGTAVLVGVLLALFGQTYQTGADTWELFATWAALILPWVLLGRLAALWLAQRWATWLLAAASGTAATVLALHAIFGWNQSTGVAAALYPAWLVAVYVVYRRMLPDLFMLAAGCLSAIVVVAGVLTEHLLEWNDAGGFLLIAMVVVGMSAAAAVWLRRVSAQGPA